MLKVNNEAVGLNFINQFYQNIDEIKKYLSNK
jgi:hypothetical protein